MLHATRTVVVIMAALILPFSGIAQDVYIQYDAACMDRLEYAYGFTVPGSEYVKYQVQLSPTEYVILEVGPEKSNQVQEGFTGSAFQCGNPGLSEELADKIRNADVNAYIVKEQNPNQFSKFRINQASYFRRDALGVSYKSWQFSFDHSGGLRVGENLTEDSIEGVNVFFQGPTTFQCAEAYLFRQTFQFADPGAYRDITFVPGIGIVEERPANGSPSNIYKLTSVNGQPFEDYLSEQCGKGIAASYDFLPPSNQTVKGGLQPYTGGAPPTAAGNQPVEQYPSMSPANPPITHTVAPSETLFALSRQYGVSVQSIQEWNNMDSETTIKIGQVLTVSDPQTSPAMASSYNYKGNAGESAAWKTTTGSHTVQAGESITALANQYGYTEARFRDMNNLPATQTASPGMVLKTSETAIAQNNPVQPANPATNPGAGQPVSRGTPQAFVPPANTTGTNPPAGNTTLPSNNSNTAGANEQTAASRGTTQPFTPPSTQTQNSATLPTGTQPANSGIQPFTPPNTQNNATLPTNTQPANNGAIQPFTPPGIQNNATLPANTQPADSGIQPFTPPSTTSTQQPGQTNTSVPEPAQRPPSSSFGTPVQPSSSTTSPAPPQSNPANTGTTMLNVKPEWVERDTQFV